MGSRIRNPEQAEHRGYMDARHGASISLVPYSDDLMAQAWERGYRRRTQEAYEKGEPRDDLRIRRVIKQTQRI